VVESKEEVYQRDAPNPVADRSSGWSLAWRRSASGRTRSSSPGTATGITGHRGAFPETIMEPAPSSLGPSARGDLRCWTDYFATASGRLDSRLVSVPENVSTIGRLSRHDFLSDHGQGLAARIAEPRIAKLLLPAPKFQDEQPAVAQVAELCRARRICAFLQHGNFCENGEPRKGESASNRALPMRLPSRYIFEPAQGL
jgi:hypothetical protein